MPKIKRTRKLVIPANKREDDLVKQEALVEVDDKGELPFRLTIDIVLSRLALFCNLCSVTCVLYGSFLYLYLYVCPCVGNTFAGLAFCVTLFFFIEIDNLILCILGKVSFVAKVFICLKENCVWLGTHYPTG